MYKSDDPKIMAIVDFTLKNFGEAWYENPQAVARMHDLFFDYRVIDRIVPLSAYKNIFTRGKILKEKPVEFAFEKYDAGQILSVDINKIGLKATVDTVSYFFVVRSVREIYLISFECRTSSHTILHYIS